MKTIFLLFKTFHTNSDQVGEPIQNFIPNISPIKKPDKIVTKESQRIDQHSNIKKFLVKDFNTAIIYDLVSCQCSHELSSFPQSMIASQKIISISCNAYSYTFNSIQYSLEITELYAQNNGCFLMSTNLSNKAFIIPWVKNS